MGSMIDETGNRHGRLVVIERAGNLGKKATWRCRCDCGREIVTLGKSMRLGLTRSCGCYKLDVQCSSRGLSRTATYRSWCAMKARCSNPSHRHYANYGGRGISVCKRWSDSFNDFYLDMGPMPAGMTIDRINNNGNYEPGNCRWANRIEQSENRRNNRRFSFQGKEMCVSAIARETGIYHERLRTRLKRGWSIERAVSAG